MAGYYIAAGSDRKGPFTLAELAGQPIAGDTLVWQAGMVDWVRAETVTEIREHLETLPPPLPPPLIPPIPARVDAPRHAPLPPMARAICFYGQRWSPGIWIVGNLFLLFGVNWSSPVYLAGEIINLLGALPTTILLYLGARRLRAGHPSALKPLKIGLWIDMGLAALIMVVYVVTMNDPADDLSPGERGIEALLSFLQIGGLFFEIAALVWLYRHGGRLLADHPGLASATLPSALPPCDSLSHPGPGVHTPPPLRPNPPDPAQAALPPSAKPPPHWTDRLAEFICGLFVLLVIIFLKAKDFPALKDALERWAQKHL